MINTLIHGDACVELSKTLPSSDLIFFDPPFNIGYEYDSYKDKKTDNEYLEWIKTIGTYLRGNIKNTGSLWIAIGDEYAAQFKLMFEDLGFKFRNWIIWYYSFGVACKKKFARCHTHLLHFSRSNDFTFNSDEIRIPSARQQIYKDKRANSTGKIPENVWILQASPDLFDCSNSVWHNSRVCGTFKERLDFPCQMPEAILERIIKVSTNEGDLVLDPMFGSATCLAVSKKLKRNYIGIELSENYFEIGKKRLDNIQ